jgi:protein involved in polysaccharide export with SLBB domain
MSRQRVYCCAATALLFLSLFVGGSVLTARQERPEPIPEPPGSEVKKKGALPPDRQHAAVEAKRREAEVALDKMFAECDLKPHGLPAIADDPPPHEGAMIGYPEVIEPPDLLLVEVLEALPGRPISGERLVRQDGTISLGFYGDLHVAGLTLKQAKVRIIQHLRRFLTDEALGLYDIQPPEEGEMPADAKRPKVDVPIPELPKDRELLQPVPESKPKATQSKPRAIPSRYRVRSVRQSKEIHSFFGRSRPGASIRLVGRVQEAEQKKADEPQKTVKIPLEAGGQVTITIEVQTGEKKEKEKEEATEVADDWVPGPLVTPEDSARVFINITAYNSKNYYLEGDLTIPGRLPFTGRETVMDALDYGGGLLPTAEPRDIRLVRPARGGKPARVYKVDLEAIREKGDVTSNYQVFPGDRLIVGRNDVVKKTIQVDRLAAGMQTVITAISQESSLLRSLMTTSPENHEAILKDLVDFWIAEMKRPDGVVLDEQTLREALIRRLQAKPEKK